MRQISYKTPSAKYKHNPPRTTSSKNKHKPVGSSGKKGPHRHIDKRRRRLGVKWLKSICIQSLLSSRHPVDQIAERNLLFSSAFPNVNGPCPGAEKLNGEVAPPPADVKNITGMNTNHAGLGPFASLFSRQIVWSRTGSVYRVRYSPSFTNRASLGSPSSRSFCQSQE